MSTILLILSTLFIAILYLQNQIQYNKIQALECKRDNLQESYNRTVMRLIFERLKSEVDSATISKSYNMESGACYDDIEIIGGNFRLRIVEELNMCQLELFGRIYYGFQLTEGQTNYIMELVKIKDQGKENRGCNFNINKD